jgi:ATP-binding cassette subfamily A (ABC1) protein 3
LKTTYGAGYKLFFDKDADFTEDQLAALTNFVTSNVPKAKLAEIEGDETQVVYELPFESIGYFGPFFTRLETDISKFNVSNFGITLTSLEDVFLQVGEDQDSKPKPITGEGIGNKHHFSSSFPRQVLAMMSRRLMYARKDFITVPLIGLPIAVAIAAVVLYDGHYISNADSTNDIIASALYAAGYVGAPGLLAEFIVRERSEKLRTLLTVMGCGFAAYWIGTFLADLLLMLIPLIVIYITWRPGRMEHFIEGSDGAAFYLLILFTIHLVAFTYICSFLFRNPKYCIAIMPMFIIVLVTTPALCILLFTYVCDNQLHWLRIHMDVEAGVNLWGVMILSPHGALFAALFNAVYDFSAYITHMPSFRVCVIFMICESVVFLLMSYYLDTRSIAKLRLTSDPTFDEVSLRTLDEDVLAEREAVLNSEAVPRASNSNVSNSTIQTSSAQERGLHGVATLHDHHEPKQVLRVERLRKVFPPATKNGTTVVATEDLCFAVKAGEIFGLLGANGAGKTTALSMLTRHIDPTSGDASIAGISILSSFPKAAHHLGVVTQNNSLWDVLTVEDHLTLFAGLRGVPVNMVKGVVDATIDQLELTPHRHKQSRRLSGGMKRKLCVAIALIGDPEVVLLDEPSAGMIAILNCCRYLLFV